MRTSKEEWMKLVDRYFEADTDEAEEARLRRFLVTEEAAGVEFDEARAVMGLFATGRALRRSGRTGRVFRLPSAMYKVAAVALLLLVGSVTWRLVDSQRNVCVAYIYGEECTDVETVMAQMRHSLGCLDYDEEDLDVEGQLSDIFQTLGEGDNL